ncbi:hypothetical protein TNCV_1816441 [Trichonephila clavipes]|nr:hypothetical protein TNCV_1816441 [Trichonephila clavipes]
MQESRDLLWPSQCSCPWELRCMSRCPDQLNIAEKEPILPQLKRFKRKWKIFDRNFQNPRPRTVTSNGSTECRNV